MSMAPSRISKGHVPTRLATTHRGDNMVPAGVDCLFFLAQASLPSSMGHVGVAHDQTWVVFMKPAG